MKVYDLKGRLHSWNLVGYEPPKNATRPRSALHVRARALLNEIYPSDKLLEEVPLPGLNLFADFYLPLRKTLVEVHGEQHYKFVPHFHGSIQGYAKSRINDNNKKEWCQINNLTHLILPYDEDDDEWRERIKKG